MKIDILPIGLYQENSYVLHDQGHVLFIDPGRYAKTIAEAVNRDETVDGILLTHGHEDHTGAADDLADMFETDIYMHENDLALTDPAYAKMAGYCAPVYHTVKPLSAKMKIGVFDIEVIETPGHTAGSVCFRYRNLLFTGDTLFASDIGRTDLYSGDEEEMMRSLQKFYALPHDLRVLPGHGPCSTIGLELQRNPYL